MALENIDINSPSVKYGAASELKFGCPESDDFDILESVSATASYQTDVQVKNEVGNTIGQVIGDPKIEISMNGYGKTAPKALGAVTEFKHFLSAIGSDEEPEEEAKSEKFCVKSVKQDNSNEDFVKFEIQAERYPNLDYDTTQDLTTGSDEFSN